MTYNPGFIYIKIIYRKSGFWKTEVISGVTWKPGVGITRFDIISYITEISKTGTIRIKGHKRAFNSGDVKPEFVCHALEIDDVPNFNKVKVLASSVNIYDPRMFLEGVFTKL